MITQKNAQSIHGWGNRRMVDWGNISFYCSDDSLTNSKALKMQLLSEIYSQNPTYNETDYLLTKISLGFSALCFTMNKELTCSFLESDIKGDILEHPW